VGFDIGLFRKAFSYRLALESVLIGIYFGKWGKP